jgi:xylulokinase
MSYLGLDIGTGACKAVVFDAEGKELASAHREYRVHHPHPDWAELDSIEVITKCFEVIREVNARTKDPVSSMGISSQGEAFTPVAEDGEVLGNAMVSSDSRAVRLASEWSAAFGEEKLYRITGHTPHPLFTLYKLLWVKENQPGAWEKARYFLCFEDLFHLRVGVRPVISWPLAGRTMLFDVQKHKWSDEILSAIGLDPGKLAVPLPSGKEVGYIEGKYAKDLGFENPVLIAAGGHDQPCATLGAGITEPGTCMYATGSVECFCPVLLKPSFSGELMKNNLCCYDFTMPGYYTSVAYSLTGGNILRWMRDQLGQDEVSTAGREGTSAYSLLLDNMPGTPTDLLVLPYFSATGTPYFDTRARGAIIGLRHTTTKGEITKALLEGVAFEMKLNLELMEASGMEVHTFIATGGGTRDDRWTRMKADILNKKIIVRDISEAGCFGAALLARSAETGIPVKEILHGVEQGSKSFHPDPGKADLYEEKFKQYKKLYPALRQFWTGDQ